MEKIVYLSVFHGKVQHFFLLTVSPSAWEAQVLSWFKSAVEQCCLLSFLAQM